MIEKIKYCLLKVFKGEQIRIRAIAVMSALTIAVITLLGNSTHTVKIFDGEKTYTVRTLTNNIASVLKSVNLKSNSYNVIKTTVDNRFTQVEIAYTFPVYVTQGDTTTTIQFTGGTVKEALATLDITIDEFDFVEPSQDTVLTKTAYIDYTNIDYVNGTYEEVIPHKTTTVYSSKHNKGYSSVQSGSDGLQSVSYTEKFVNGVSEGKIITGTSILTNAVAAIKTVGTKSNVYTTSSSVNCISTLVPAKPIELDANGIPVSYKSKMTVRATAYTYTGNNCSTGVKPQPGYIAVNPKVIPYGTKMFIKTCDGKYIYGYAVAADTGGFIKKHPTGVDLFFTTESACRAFGVRNAEIYILE